QESCARLIVDCARPQTVDVDSIWRVKGSSNLGRPALAVLCELWHWREAEAIRANRPPFFILSHEKMADIAAAAAAHHSIENLLSPRMSPRRRDNLIHAIKTGLALPANLHPEIIRQKFHRPSETEFRRFRELQKHRDAHAHKLGIDPTLIASKSTLGDLARDWDRHAPELMNWQCELLK
ncbi:MAG: HRDC domain-containing protein, partial [Limisphaerales bacterium]